MSYDPAKNYMDALEQRRQKAAYASKPLDVREIESMAQFYRSKYGPGPWDMPVDPDPRAQQPEDRVQWVEYKGPGYVSYLSASDFATTTIQPKPDNATLLRQAKEQIDQLTELLERVQKEPLILYTIDRLSKDKKHAYIKKQDTEIRIEACKDLDIGHEVLLHPKTFQIVEHLGRPPLEASPFSPFDVPNVTWEDIGGLEEAKAQMIEAIEMPHKHKDLYTHYCKRPLKGILLAGPPGCGKTLLGKAAAKALSTIYGKENARTGFLYVKGPEVLNMYVGQTEQTIRDMFYAANQHKEEKGYPAIIFLDEADALLATRGNNSSVLGNTIVPQFLTEMDGLQESSAIVILATNRPDVLDPAIVRDGRIDRKITIARPSQKNAVQILKINLARVPLWEGETIDSMAEMMAAEIYSPQRLLRKDVYLSTIVSGALLANCVDIATSCAIRRDLATNTQTGLLPEDALAAIDRIQEQSHAVQHGIEITMSIRETGGE